MLQAVVAVVQVTPAKDTEAPEVPRLEPPNTTVVPPAVGPLEGVTEEMEGGLREESTDTRSLDRQRRREEETRERRAQTGIGWRQRRREEERGERGDKAQRKQTEIT